MNKNYLIFSDIHIKEQDLPECQLVLDEILSLCNEYKITEVYNAGDTFNELLPDSNSLDMYANFIQKLNRPITTIIAQSHESTTSEDSVLNHYGILFPQIKLCKEYKDKNNLYIGHFIVKEAKKGKFGSTISKEDLKQYSKVYLGHQHQNQELDNVVQIGSCRWINFDESEDKGKYIYIIQDYGSKDEKVNKIALKSPYPMVDVVIDPNLENKARSAPNLMVLRGILDAFKDKTKVRCIFKDYSLWRSFLPLEEVYKEKFVLFKIKKDFTTNEIIIAKKEKQPLKESLEKWMNVNKVDNKIRQILLKEIK